MLLSRKIQGKLPELGSRLKLGTLVDNGAPRCGMI
jgi:hypothetical protein